VVRSNTATEIDARDLSVAVLGLGNPVVSDDAVGLHVAAELERLLKDAPNTGVKVMTSSRGGFDLIRLLTGYSRAIIIDALELPNPCPGRIHRLQLGMLSGSARLVGVHDISLADAFELAKTIGIPMPAIVEIFAVEGGEMQTLGEEMTPEVAAVVAPLAKEVFDMACKWVNKSMQSVFAQNCAKSSD
jgi:hydrogenase maturation protease